MIGISIWFCKILLRNPLCKTGCHGTREKNLPVTVNKWLKKKKSHWKSWLLLPLWRDPRESLLLNIFLSDLGKGMMITKFTGMVFFKEVGTTIQYDSL